MEMIRLLFKIGFIYHKAAMDPLIDAFAGDPKYDIAISLEEERMKKWGIFNRPAGDKFGNIIDDGRFRITDENERFDVIIVGDTIRDAAKYGGTLLCFINHGTGIKNILYRNLKRHAGTKYMIFVEGDYRVEKLKESGCLGESEVFKVGLPKLDPYFLEGYFNREKILSKYNLNPKKKTVLFAPTYKPTCMYEVKDHIFTETRDYNLIIKLHHYSWMGKYAPHRQHKMFEKRVAEYPHSVLIPVEDYNILSLMAAADTLISEASSTVFDFLAMNKTGIIFDLEYEKMKHSNGEYVLTTDNREFLKGAFVHINKPSQISDAIMQALNPTKEMIELADGYRKYFFHRLDGRASFRVKTEVERLLKEGTHFSIV
ncbi:MAG: CDP-glycerol glycerophosphotransferase family protein [candidate division Zixibacteria bacterium]|nr:CDP-glycerol glycerophosphotransferase family protein [Candidatus Tariuqbacter arcticus]